MFIDLTVQRCIVTGEQPTLYSGHVVATDCYGNKLKIGAAFKDADAREASKSDDDGCYGEWQVGYGVEHVPFDDYDSIRISGATL